MIDLDPPEEVSAKRRELYALHSKLCGRAFELMRRKNIDYATDDDPLWNFRRFGADGILIRMDDKLSRLLRFVDTGEFKVTEENLDDTILDIINYAVLLHFYLSDLRKEIGQ